MKPQERSFKFRLVDKTGEETFTFSAEPDDASIEKALRKLNEDFKLHLEYDSCMCMDACRCHEHNGHFVTLERWKYDNPMRSWEGETVHYHAELLVEGVNKKGETVFYRYYEDPMIY